MSKYGVFIIESLDLKNEENRETDGFVLQQILDLYEIENKYYYIRTKKELEEIIELFEESELRYLHLSCHANSMSISLTFDSLSYEEFGNIVGNKLAGRRLFLSACNASNFDLAKELIPKYKCQSIIGSPVKVEFAQAVAFWTGFYYNMSRVESAKMLQPTILGECEALCSVFDVQINYYSFIRKEKKFNTSKIREHKIIPNQDTISKIRKV